MNDLDGLKLDSVTPAMFAPMGIGKTAANVFFDIVDTIVTLVGPGAAVDLLRETASAIEDSNEGGNE